jgi:hypothetical protein
MLVTVHAGAEVTPGLSDSSPAILPVESALARLDGYLDCLTAAPATVTIDGSLLQQLRLAIATIEELLQQTPEAERSFWQEKWQARQDRWAQLQQELPVTVRTGPVEVALDDVLGNLPQPGTPNTYAYLSSQPVLAVTWSSKPAAGRWPEYALTWGTVCVSGLVLMWLMRALPVREWLAEHPAWAGLLAGTVWWSWLSPSVAGFVLVILSGALLLGPRRSNEANYPTAQGGT